MKVDNYKNAFGKTRDAEAIFRNEMDKFELLIDEKSKQVLLTERGQEKVERILQERGLLDEEQSLYSASSISLLHHVNAALRAHTLFEKDVDYIVNDKGEVVIVDEHTGRQA